MVAAEPEVCAPSPMPCHGHTPPADPRVLGRGVRACGDRVLQGTNLDAFHET